MLDRSPCGTAFFAQKLFDEPENAAQSDQLGMLLAGALVFFMQAGFAMLEAGIVAPKNVTNILFKVLKFAETETPCLRFSISQ